MNVIKKANQLIDYKELVLEQKDISIVYRSFCRIGGENGWYGYDMLWRLRGYMDKLIGGVGNRGRNNLEQVSIGDFIDIWEVADCKEDEILLLHAQMKLPGEAWLEFKIEDNKLKQTAYFNPSGIFGYIYWYSMLPFHYLIFNNMIKQIVKNAK
jgi:hypothetical protein